MSIHSPTADPKLLNKANEIVDNYMRQVVGENETDVEPGTLPGLAGRIMEHAGHLPGKYDPPVALSTHIINTIATGITAYVYDRVVRQQGEINITEARLLISALALHDTNKYIEGCDDYDVSFDTRSNTTELLDFYFDQGDDFGVKTVLPGESEDELELDIADVKWLIQRTEVNDSSGGTRGDSTPRVRGLERYCRIGDGFVSKVHRDGMSESVGWLETRFDDGLTDRDNSGIHHLTFTELEQSIINNELLEAAKNIISGDVETHLQSNDQDGETFNSKTDASVWGVVLGSTPDSVVYFGNEIPEDELRSHLKDEFEHQLSDVSFSAKTQWNSFEYNVLDEVDIPFEQKHQIIAKGYVEELKKGSGTNHEFAKVPGSFASYLPELVEVVFGETECPEYLVDYPSLHQLWEELAEGDTYNNQTIKIGFVAELLRRYTASVDDGYDPVQVQEELSQLQSSMTNTLQTKLQPDFDGIPEIVDRFIETDLPTVSDVPASDEMCFLCGRPASDDFTKGSNSFYGGRSFSKRVSAEASKKKICPVCNLEHALLRDAVEEADYNVDEDIKIAFIYYDDFVADLGLEGSDDPQGLIRALQGDDDDETVRANIADPRLLASSYNRQYHLQPFYVAGKNSRLEQVRSLLNTLVRRGFKITIGKPFAGFTPEDALFVDTDASRLQVAYGADRIDSYEQLNRVTRLFDILNSVGYSMAENRNKSRYDIDAMTQLQAADFHTIAALVGRETEMYDTARSLAHDHFVATPEYNSQYMMMRDVAQAGYTLYGHEYDSRYKKTKLFRKAIDATLDGLNQGKEGESLVEHVSGQVYKPATADAEQDHYVQPENAREFVEAIFEYLQSDGELDKTTLSQRRNNLSNTYLFAYDQLLKEINNKNADEDNEDSDESTESSANSTRTA